jgi:serine kinase of HPr protein (carbohydrate metabolism regulator)
VCVFVASGIQQAIRMRRIVILAYPALKYFPTMPKNGAKFENKNVIEHKISVSIFSKTFVWNTSRSKKN